MVRLLSFNKIVTWIQLTAKRDQLSLFGGCYGKATLLSL